MVFSVTYYLELHCFILLLCIYIYISYFTNKCLIASLGTIDHQRLYLIKIRTNNKNVAMRNSK